jgi:glutathione synthase/RimK-type ligase-like ATP-grasp enzyme
MKIAIHHTSGSFSERWISYCDNNKIDYKIVNCYDSDIIHQLENCGILLWHHDHMDSKDALFAKQLIYTLEHAGKKVFPNYKTCWHFDDKVGQKYLFEAIGAPLVPSYTFYTKSDAIQWAKSTTYPKVFKLRGGAGSANVKLVKSPAQAVSLIKRAFGKGFPKFDRKQYMKERFRKWREGKDNISGVFKGIGRLVISTEFEKMSPVEKGYVYFQDFIPDNTFDIRVIVVDEKAFAIKRMVRNKDFRASGSGNIYYEEEHFSSDLIKLSFDITDRLQSQCAAYDFVFDKSGKPMVVEVSYGFATKAYDKCVGYWDKSLQFHKGPFIPQNWMIESVIKK